MVPEGGLEPPHLSAYAPQAYMSTIPSPGQNYWIYLYLYMYPSRVSSHFVETRSREYGSRIFAVAHFESHIYHSITRAGEGFYGAPSRVRTYNQRFRRPLLFQLSYGCVFPYNSGSSWIIEKSVKKANLLLETLIIFLNIMSEDLSRYHFSNCSFDLIQ